MAPNTLIPTRAERFIARTCKDDYANLRVFAAVIEGVYQFRQRLWPERIAHLGSIDGNLSHALGFLKNNVCIVADFLPFYWHIILLVCYYWACPCMGLHPLKATRATIKALQ